MEPTFIYICVNFHYVYFMTSILDGNDKILFEYDDFSFCLSMRGILLLWKISHYTLYTNKKIENKKTATLATSISSYF